MSVRGNPRLTQEPCTVWSQRPYTFRKASTVIDFEPYPKLTAMLVSYKQQRIPWDQPTLIKLAGSPSPSAFLVCWEFLDASPASKRAFRFNHIMRIKAQLAFWKVWTAIERGNQDPTLRPDKAVDVATLQGMLYSIWEDDEELVNLPFELYFRATPMPCTIEGDSPWMIQLKDECTGIQLEYPFAHYLMVSPIMKGVETA